MTIKPVARILLAEDDGSMRDFLAKALERAGHHVTACADGEEALAAFEESGEGAFDLLLTDVCVPGLDGIALAQRATAADVNLHVMFITGFAVVPIDQVAPHKDPLRDGFHLRQLVDQVDAWWTDRLKESAA